MTKDEAHKTVKSLADKADAATTSEEAMKYAHAASHIANAYATLVYLEINAS